MFFGQGKILGKGRGGINENTASLSRFDESLLRLWQRFGDFKDTLFKWCRVYGRQAFFRG